ncbi:LysR family transcriptional regulator [Blautia sp. OM07-19]|nr:LysR family transcriptional regulator [Blautia sp. OM07-19]
MYLHWEIFCWRLMKSALLVCGLKARNAQPSLSKQLMELEKKLGKQLLIRGKKKITLTEEGVILRKRRLAGKT